MSKNFNVDTLGLSTLLVIPGAADPSAGGGVVAAIGSLYLRSGTGQVWQKTGAGNTAWTQIATLAANPTAPNGVGWYGTGVDGNLTFDGVATVGTFAGLSLAPVANVYTLTRDIFCDNMTVSTGVRINPSGFGIFVLNTLTLNGTGNISAPGGNGANGAAGAGGAGGSIAFSSTNIYSGGQAGVVGGNPDAGSGGSGSVPNLAINSHLGAATANTAQGGNGGTLQGGGGGTNNNNAAAGTVGGAPTGLLPAARRFFHNITQALNGKDVTGAQMACGSAGSSGRGAGAGVGGGGGGSGATGGTVAVFARLITGTGTISALGGNGGNGLTGGGGGGGGSGGILNIVTDSSFATLPVTLSVAGGNGGNAGGTGTSAPGGTGGPGLIYRFNPNRPATP